MGLLDKLRRQPNKDSFAKQVLPQVDTVAFMREPEGEPVMAPWDRVVEVAGDLMVPLDIYPERWRVMEFPGEGQLRVLSENSS